MYCTVQDVRNVLAPVDAQGTTGTATGLPDDQIEDQIREAQARIDMLVRTRYIIPLEGEGDAQVAAEPIRMWTRNIAAYLATLVYKRNKDVLENDPIRLRYSETIALLLDVRDGRSDLNLPPVEVGGEGDITVLNQYEGTLFAPGDFQLSNTGRWWPDGFGIWPGGPGAW